MTQSFGDIATATRIESTRRRGSISSTLTTVAQKALTGPATARAGFIGLALARRCCRCAEEVVLREVEQIEPAESFTQPS